MTALDEIAGKVRDQMVLVADWQQTKDNASTGLTAAQARLTVLKAQLWALIEGKNP